MTLDLIIIDFLSFWGSKYKSIESIIMGWHKGIISEVLILGAIEKDGKVILVHPSQKAENGLDIA